MNNVDNILLKKDGEKVDDFHKITVEKTKKGLKIINPTNYKLLGKGVQGAVFKLSEDRCVKIYAKERHWQRERESLQAGQVSSIVPRVYEVGKNYIVMEYIDGQPLKTYLKSKGDIPHSMAKQLVFVFKEMEKIGFTRIDASLRHLILTKCGEIRVIDHVNSLDVQIAWPFRFFRGLARLKLLDRFMIHLEKLDPELYGQWEKLMATSKDFKLKK